MHVAKQGNFGHRRWVCCRPNGEELDTQDFFSTTKTYTVCWLVIGQSSHGAEGLWSTEPPVNRNLCCYSGTVATLCSQGRTIWGCIRIKTLVVCHLHLLLRDLPAPLPLTPPLSLSLPLLSLLGKTKQARKTTWVVLEVTAWESQTRRWSVQLGSKFRASTPETVMHA